VRQYEADYLFDLTVKRELNQPPAIAGDEKATEMIRVWIAHNQLHVSMLLGMWQDIAFRLQSTRPGPGRRPGALAEIWHSCPKY
jgi:hypothetical protein